MIKVVKLQHFGSKAPGLELASSTFVPSSTNNQIQLKTFEQIKLPKSPTKDVQKLFINLNQQNNDEKKITNINRSKSATEMTVLRNNFNEIVKINNLNLNENENSPLDDSQKVWRKSILRKQSLKQKKIIEWAKKKSATMREEQLINEHLRNQPDELSRNNTGSGAYSSRSKKNEDDDDFTNFVGDAAAAIIQKTDIERNLRAKLFERELIDLSKARFKKLEMMDYQKKLFIEKQLKKAKSLPGLLRYVCFFC
jgi:hypothetical protein